MLATLDDRDLRLERLKWASQYAPVRQASTRQALAERNRAQAQILEAQFEQAQAQLALLDEQLARTRLVAPFDGVIVKGDLCQSLGAPVERGNVLFEIAPLDAYRVILKVDERDITDVAVGQARPLALIQHADDETSPFTVEKITPVSTADGRPQLLPRRGALRPGAPSGCARAWRASARSQVERAPADLDLDAQLVDWLRHVVWTWCRDAEPPVSDSLFSPSWYRVAALEAAAARPRARSTATVTAAQVWFVLQDHAAGRSHRFSPAAHHCHRPDGRRAHACRRSGTRPARSWATTRPRRTR